MNKLTKNKPDDLKVFISSRDSTCDECKEELGRYAWIMLHGDKGALCLSCADLDHLVFLPSGDAALTRSSKKHSGLSAVVLKWSRARKHYERQGLLVESEAVEKAETECEATAHQREIRRARAMLRRAELDHDYVHQFAERVREMYPQCPDGREQVIAEHACRKYSGRVGRSAEAKDFAEEAVRLAVKAHIRHTETNYDELLSTGMDRAEARVRVRPDVSKIASNWQSTK
ncbi:MAG: DUF2293 domain-containing protein [Kiritimatiellia bacterium]|jgi:hypothetical protein|nr:DUF2293 domain-containing protein [Kiritimatiellia bacterium]